MSSFSPNNDRCRCRRWGRQSDCQLAKDLLDPATLLVQQSSPGKQVPVRLTKHPPEKRGWWHISDPPDSCTPESHQPKTRKVKTSVCWRYEAASNPAFVTSMTALDTPYKQQFPSHCTPFVERRDWYLWLSLHKYEKCCQLWLYGCILRFPISPWPLFLPAFPKPHSLLNSSVCRFFASKQREITFTQIPDSRVTRPRPENWNGFLHHVVLPTVPGWSGKSK